MGTSRSSGGAPSGVPLVPPWVPDPAAPPHAGEDPAGQDQQAQPANPALAPQPVPLAPAGRFGPARTSLGTYARTGSGDEMKRGLGHYVHKGLGGAATASRRMAGTARTAGTLYGALSAAAAGQAPAPGSPFDPALLAGRSADDVMDALVEAVRPVDGTQDGEASRDAIRNALSELLARFPDADLLNLSEEQRALAIERFLALDVFNRLRLDLGKTLQDKAPSATAALARLREIKEYVRETVAAGFRALRKAGEQLGARRIAEMARQALRQAFDVFEDYVR